MVDVMSSVESGSSCGVVSVCVVMVQVWVPHEHNSM